MLLPLRGSVNVMSVSGSISQSLGSKVFTGRHLLPTLLLCWIVAVLGVYYRNVWVLRSSLGKPLVGALSVLLAAEILGFAFCRVIRWRPENWREAIPVQLSAGLGAIAY